MQAMTAGKVKGIDVSHHNGVINWTKVKQAGYQFAYIKATEGQTFNDSMFLTNAKGAKAAGLKVGAYHFARPDSATDAVAEAKHFVAVIKQVSIDLLPCLDLEASNISSASSLASWVDAFASYVKAQTGKGILLYTGLWFVNKYPGLSTKLAKYPLWVSYYRTSAPPNNGWSAWTMWQYTDKGTVPGISGGVDLNVATSLDAILATKPAPEVAAQVDDMYDLSIAKDYKLVGLRSSKHPEEICETVGKMMEANANFIVIAKRDADMTVLQKTLNEILSENK